jgi:hypothetical protein
LSVIFENISRLLAGMTGKQGKLPYTLQFGAGFLEEDCTMAKAAKAAKGRGTSKSQHVRDYQSQHPGASVAEVVEGLKKQGLEVTEGLVYSVRGYDARKASSPKRSTRASANGKAKRGASARKKSKAGNDISKAQAIRDAYNELGLKTRPRDVKLHLSQRGINVAPAQISSVRAKMVERRKARRAAAGAVSSARSAGKGRSAAGKTVTINDLMKAKQLAEKLGGIPQARQLLDTLERLR